MSILSFAAPPVPKDAPIPAVRLWRRCRAADASNGAVVLAALALAFLCYRCGERIAIGEGYGWDGFFYGKLAEDFTAAFKERAHSEYHVGRVLPSALMHYGLRLLHVPRIRPNIICVFGLLNVGVVGLAAWIWCRLADHEKIGPRGKWLGFVGLFVNFAFLKWAFYCPVLTDSYAFLIGLLMFYCYVTDRPWALIALTALGLFVWPALLYQGLPLLVFPRNRMPAVRDPAPWRLNRWLAAAGALAACAWVAWVLLKKNAGFQSSVLIRYLAPIDYQPPSAIAVAFLLCVFLYLGFGAALLADHASLFRPRSWLRSVRLAPLIVGIVVLLAAKGLLSWLSAEPNMIGTHDALVHLAWTSIRMPGLFGVAHVVYFGPIVLLAFLRWRRVCRALHSYGPGLTLCVGGHLLLGLDCESRHLIHFFPIVVFGVVKSMAGVRWGALPFALFVLVAVVFSKVWLTIGGSPDYTAAGDFPAQLLFMNLGPWMSRLMYFVQGSYVVLAGCLLYVVASPRFARQAEPESVPQAEPRSKQAA